MAELNKVLLIGRLTKDPELRYTPGGIAVAEFRMAVNHTYRTKEEKREETCFIDISVLGRSAEVIKEYLQKGREVFVEGRLQLDSWETPNGEKRSRYKVIADRWQFIGGSGRSSGGPGQQDPGQQDSGEDDAPHERAREAAAGDDDLPF
jgi:single-strand DNA-binding protein